MIKLVSLELKDFKQYEWAKIVFPEQGRILIKGKNEAGKSTLFEAIVFALFGVPVYLNDRQRRNLIRFNSKSAMVSLEVKTDEKIIKIQRKLSLKRDGGTEQDGLLEIKSLNSGLPSYLKKITEIDKKIVLELGIDYNILVNTCFVGQKRLGQLEALDANKRREIIARLFNLEYLEDIKEKAQEERKGLEKKIQEYEIIRQAGEAKRRLPELERSLKEIEEREKEIESIEKAKEIKRLKTELKELIENIGGLQGQWENISKKVEKLKKYREEKRKVEEIIKDKEKIEFLEKQREKIKKEIKEEEEKIEKLPILEEELKTLSEVLEIKREIEKKRKEKDTLNNIFSNLQRDFLQIQEIYNRISQIPYIEKDIEKLTRLINLKKREEKINLILQKQREFFEERENQLNLLAEIQEHRREKENIIYQRKKVKNKILLTSFLFVPALALLLINPVISILLAVFFTSILIQNYLQYSKIRDKILKLDSIIETKEKSSKEKFEEKRNYYEELNKLKSLKEYKKAQGERILHRIREIVGDISLDNLTKEKIEKEKDLQNLRKEKEKTEKIIEDLAAKLRCGKNIEEIESSLKKIQKAIEDFENKIEELIEKDRYPEEDLSKFSQKIGSKENEIENIRKLSKDIEEKKKTLSKLEEEMETIQREIKLKISSLQEKIPEEEIKNYLERLEEIIKGFEEEKVEEEEEKLKAEIHRKNGEKEKTEQLLTQLLKDFELNSPQKNWEELCQLDIPLQEKERLKRRKNELVEERGACISYLKAYQQKTGKNWEELDPEKVDKEYNLIKKEITKFTYAEDILDITKNTMLKAVLPRTMAYMQKILPILTMDRYHYAEIDEETYKLKVYTNYQQEPIDKEIFSGGTQDQLSLALRLSFAMATLPQNKGVQPGFIFLDEPLGSFDEERAEALIQLLTQGEVFQHFDQIFVVTHVPIKEELFDKIIYIENGRIIEREND